MRNTVLAVTLLFSAVNSPAAIIIDNFTAGDLQLESAGSTTQEDLETTSVVGGQRHIQARALRSAPLDLSIGQPNDAFSFSSTTFGYFSLTYRIEDEQKVDLFGDGSTSFQLNFSHVDPGFYRGLYELSVDGISYHFGRELFAIDGPGTIEIPFSEFTDESTFAPSEIILSAARVEPNLRLELASISTIPEPSTSLGLLVGGVLLTVTGRARSRS